MSSNNRHRYYKYKAKYLELRNKLNLNLSRQKSDKIMKTFETHDGYRVPYHEEYLENISPELIINDPTKGSLNFDKILIINTVEAFDIFTKLYCKEVFDQKYMYVRWEHVAKNFRGFYIDRNNKELYLERYDMCNYKDKDMFDSWWSKEFDNTNVVIFDK